MGKDPETMRLEFQARYPEVSAKADVLLPGAPVPLSPDRADPPSFGPGR